jgi:2-isopropylmalate synthase
MTAAKKDRVIIFDTTLRDGEQSPGASLDHREKLEIAHQLAQLGVDVIEAGFPIASPGDFRAVNDVAKTVKGPIVAGLARCVSADIVRCAEAVAPAARPRIHVFLATSAIHREFKLRKARSEIIKQTVASVKQARTFVTDVEFSPEDASRTEPDFLAEVVEAAIDAGATTINIPDTVGYSVPDEFGAVIAGIFERVPNIAQAVVSVHCHNDLGLAVANSLAAIVNGARQVECTINGLGERAGNAALEELAMILRTRTDRFGALHTGIKAARLVPVSRLVSRLTGLQVQRNKAIVGANAFAHSSGVHQDGVIKKRATYEIIDPASVGCSDGSELVLSKLSGKNGLRQALTRMGVKLSDAELLKAYERFVELADKKKVIYDDDLMLIASEQMSEVHSVYTLDALQVAAGSRTIPTATVRLRRGDVVAQEAACGDGPVDAACKAIDRITKVQGRLLDYALQAVTVGKDAMGEVSLRVAFDDTVISAKAASTDIVEASAKAYLSCVNRLFSTQKLAPPVPAKKARAPRQSARPRGAAKREAR